MKNAKIYHKTLGEATRELASFITSNSYTVPECFNDVFYFQHVGYGETFRDSLPLVDSKNNGVSFQIYRLDSGNYELNCYFWK